MQWHDFLKESLTLPVFIAYSNVELSRALKLNHLGLPSQKLMPGGKLKLGGKHKRGKRHAVAPLKRNRRANGQTWRPKKASPLKRK